MRRAGFLPVIILALAAAPVLGAEFEHHSTQVIDLDGEKFPTNLTVRMRDPSATRLGTQVFIDLKSFQDRLPDLIEGPIHDDCEFGVSVNLNSIEPSDDGAILGGEVALRLNSCREENGVTYRRTDLSANVDIAALAFAEVSDNCLFIGIDDLELEAKGLIGALAGLFGIVDEARAEILQEAQVFTAENPICPDFPEGLMILDPQLESGGLRTFPNGNLGAIMRGSIEVSATSVLEFASKLAEEGAFNDLDGSDCPCEEAQ